MTHTIGRVPRTRVAGPRPRKALGQHFLHDGGVLADIAGAVRVPEGGLVVEIGAGTGQLTGALLQPVIAGMKIDMLWFATLIAVNLQTAFLSPPVAMSAYYLKGVSPPHVTINQIFAGMMPYMLIVIVCMVFMYFWPGLTLWLPNYLYGN